MSPLWTEQTLGEHFQEAADQFDQRIAIKDSASQLTYRDLLQETLEERRRLQQNGIAAGELVIMQMQNGIPFVRTFLACMMAQIVPVLMLPNHGRLEREAIQEQTGSRFLIKDDEILRLNSSNDPAYAESTEILQSKSADEKIALLLLSGGTTGIPKLIPRTHGDYYYSCMQTTRRGRWGIETVFMTPLPLAHNFGLAHPGILGALFSGGRVVIPSSASPLDLLEQIEEEQVTAVALVPTLLHLLLDARSMLTDIPLSSLQQIFVGGSMLPVSDAKKTQDLFGNVLVQVFGIAEGLICTTSPDDPPEKVCTTQGKPISEYDELKIIGPEGEILPPGQQGELLTRGPYTIHFYYGLEDMEQKYFTTDGWYRTGDLACIDEKGDVTIYGRIKECINRAGEKIVPSYLEEQLMQWGVFSELTVIGVPDKTLTERICICARPNGERSSIDLRQVNQYLMESGISGFSRADQYLEISDWPLTAVGKTNKKKLVELAEKSG